MTTFPKSQSARLFIDFFRAEIYFYGTRDLGFIMWFSDHVARNKHETMFSQLQSKIQAYKLHKEDITKPFYI